MKFGETFESEIINKFARERNYLGIKNKGKKLPSYVVKIKRDNVVFEKKITRKRDFFNGKGLIPGNSENGTFKLGEVDNLAKMKNFDDNRLELVNLSEIELQELHTIDMSVFSSNAMLKLVSKIAYEWYCKKYEIFEFREASSDIVNFILNNEGMPVEIFVNRSFNSAIVKMLDTGSHTLGILSDKEGCYVFYSFWGLVNYKVKVSNDVINIGNPVEAYVIRSDGSDFYCKLNNIHQIETEEPKQAVINLTQDILLNYERMMTQKLMTSKALKGSVLEISEILNIDSAIEKRDKLLGYREDNMLSTVHLLNNFGKKKDQMYHCFTFNHAVRLAMNTEEYVGFNKEEWASKFEKVFDSGDLEKNLSFGIELFLLLHLNKNFL